MIACMAWLATQLEVFRSMKLLAPRAALYVLCHDGSVGVSTVRHWRALQARLDIPDSTNPLLMDAPAIVSQLDFLLPTPNTAVIVHTFSQLLTYTQSSNHGLG